MMLQGLLPLRLNYLGRASALAAMVRSSKLGQAATIGAVRLVAPTHAPSSSTVAMPTCSANFAGADSLCVVLKISKINERSFCK